ncbi:winged helix-turn-helix domain-containing protein [Nitrosopumilus sp.]|uniref:winged helix-turn-helix domain-containing protein n=1 Tax=Nitrosopumilus sp. TaxID=2024843 RepID=UPI003D0B7C02
MGNESPSPLRKKILNLMEEEGPQTVKDLESKIGLSNGSSRSILVKMKEAGLVERVSPGKYQLVKSE